MNSKSTEIDQLVKARWLAMGLSQSDLAEILGVAPAECASDGPRKNGISAGRLVQVAAVLGIQASVVDGRAVATAGPGASSPDAEFEPLEWLMELRLLRVFRELQDHSTKRMLIQLTEQIAKRQAVRPGNAG